MIELNVSKKELFDFYENYLKNIDNRNPVMDSIIDILIESHYITYQTELDF